MYVYIYMHISNFEEYLLREIYRSLDETLKLTQENKLIKIN